jgi:GT2 family glycosyltransferase
MSAGRAPVAVVVVTWNAERFVRACLASLRALSRPPEEVVVVDNASSDATAAIVRDEFPEVRLIAGAENAGFCKANNIGMRATRAPFVLVLNPDTILDARFLEELLPAFDDARVGIAAGKLVRFDGVTLDSAGQQLARSRQPIDRGYGVRDRGQFDRDEIVFGACGAAALYRRAMLEALADAPGVYFDEAFFAFYEDLDLAWRARRAGWSAAYRHRATGRHARGGAEAAGPRRFTALLGRSPEVRFLVARNRWLAILRNDRVADLLRNLPFVLARDAGTLGAILLTSPGVLLRLWRERGAFGRALERRRLDAERPRHEVGAGGAP